MGWGRNSIEDFKGQNYARLRRKYIGEHGLFEDPLFPPNRNSLGDLGLSDINRVVWKRPPEFTENPRLFVEKASSKDVTQGKLGNCWFVAACAALATVKPLWKQVIPDYKLQEWDPMSSEMYAGIFHFRFWRFGRWVDVVVDDFLPTIDGQLIFCHSFTQNEFWSALLEKAYAKLCGSYASLHGGNLCDALVDFTSGLSQRIELQDEKFKNEEERRQLRRQMRKDHEKQALMSCAISPTATAAIESRTRSGLVVGHAYSITGVKKIPVGSSGLFSFFKTSETICLLRLRNPWGEKEWNGAFSDGLVNTEEASTEVAQEPCAHCSRTSPPAYSSSAVKPSLSSSSAAPSSNFRSRSHYSLGATACRANRVAPVNNANHRRSAYFYTTKQLLNLDSRSPEWNTISKSEKEKLGLVMDNDGEFWMPFDDFMSEFTDLSICHLINTSFFSLSKSWNEECFSDQWIKPNKAGGCPNHATFPQNPQYCFDVPSDEMEIMVQLLQKDKRSSSTHEYVTMGFQIMKVEVNRKYRIHKKFKAVATSDYVKARSVFYEGTLDKGRYVLLPSTFEPGMEAEFYMRIYSENNIHIRPLTKDHPEPFFLCTLCCSPPQAVTSITVKGATGLIFPADTYCIVKCERQKVRSQIVYQSNSPEWELEAVFFRNDVLKPIVVEIWEHRLFRDKFLGCASVSQTADNQQVISTQKLLGRGRHEGDRHPGEVLVAIATFDDLSTL